MSNETITENLHYNNKWRLALRRSPGVQYHCTAVEFPSISLTPIKLPTPVGNRYVGGKVVDFGQFTFTFKVDEDFSNYINIFEWMAGIAGSTDMAKYAELTSNVKNNIIGTAGHNIYTDGTLIALTNASNINREFNIINMFPIALGSPQFVGGNAEINLCTVSFQCDYFEILPKKT